MFPTHRLHMYQAYGGLTVLFFFSFFLQQHTNLLALESAPWFNSSCTHCTWLLAAARISGVVPSCYVTEENISYCSQHFVNPYGKFGLPYLGKATAATGTELPNPTSMSCFGVCLL